MKQLIYAGMSIGEVAKMGDCRVMPEVTLTFNSKGDLARFEAAMKQNTDPLAAHWIRREGYYEFAGIRFNLVLRHP